MGKWKDFAEFYHAFLAPEVRNNYRNTFAEVGNRQRVEAGQWFSLISDEIELTFKKEYK